MCIFFFSQFTSILKVLVSSGVGMERQCPFKGFVNSHDQSSIYERGPLLWMITGHWGQNLVLAIWGEPSLRGDPGESWKQWMRPLEAPVWWGELRVSVADILVGLCIFEVKVLVTQSCLTLFYPMDWSLPGSSVHGILQARILEWVDIPFSRGSFQPRDWTWVSHIAGRFFTIWAPREAQWL